MALKRKEFSTLKKSLSTKRKPGNAGVSVVIPCEPGGDPGACLRALAALPKPEKALIKEAFVAWGRHPSRQRNQAVAAAKAPWILFLDADSRAQPGLIPGLLTAARRFGALAVGGPNLALDDEPSLGRAFDRVLGSWAGSGASRARYRADSPARRCGEKELILCNLLMEREAFLAIGGFREDLYPNEENELFNRLGERGGTLAYEPFAQVRRPRRRSLGAFTQQAFRYGRGRAQQMRRNFFPSDLLNLAPALLQAGLLAALFVRAPWDGSPPRSLAYFLWPLYGAACWLSQGLGPLRTVALILRHQAYALGLWAGVFQEPALRSLDVHVERVRWTGR
jgi:hypothetical protein